MFRTFLSTVQEIIQSDDRSIFIGSDVKPGLLPEIRRSHRERFFMEGISEANVIGMAAGLAHEGFVPFVTGISCFLTRRCFEQIALDVCLHDLPVRIVGNGGGLHYARLGPTHLGVEDFALMNSLPNMTVVSPSTSFEMKEVLLQSRSLKGPLYVRVSKLHADDRRLEDIRWRIGEGVEMRKSGSGPDVLLVSTGYMTQDCIEVREILEREGINVSHLHFHTLAPFDHDLLAWHSRQAGLIVTVEEHSVVGGLGAIVRQSLGENIPGHTPPVVVIGIPKKFLSHYGTHEEQLADAGLSKANVLSVVKRHLTDRRILI